MSDHVKLSCNKNKLRNSEGSFQVPTCDLWYISHQCSVTFVSHTDDDDMIVDGDVMV